MTLESLYLKCIISGFLIPSVLGAHFCNTISYCQARLSETATTKLPDDALGEEHYFLTPCRFFLTGLKINVRQSNRRKGMLIWHIHINMSVSEVTKVGSFLPFRHDKYVKN